MDRLQRSRAPRVPIATGRDFVVGRLGGARSRLLAAAGLRDLVARPTPSEQLDLLRSTLWSAAAEARSPGETEAALEDRVLQEISSALRQLDPVGRRLVEAYLLPDDARALRGALRALAGALGPESSAPLLDPTPALSRARLREIASCTDAGAAAARLTAWGSPLARALREARADLRKPGALAGAEVAVDRAASEALLLAGRGPGADRRALRELSSSRADLSAAAGLLALASESGRGAFPIEGGRRLPPPEVARISRLDTDEVPAALAAALRDLLGEPFSAAKALSRPSLADHLLGRALARHARRLARTAPLTVAVPCAWVVVIREELRRIRLVLRATAEGFPAPTLLDLLEA